MKVQFGAPLIDEKEKEAVKEVLNGPILVHGPKAKLFEKSFAEFTNAPHAVSVSSCTAGMHLIYFALGYGPGDEVIVPAQTHIATAHAVELTGAKPIFVDADENTGNIKIEDIEKKITSRTRAIAVVHYLGVPVDMEKVCLLANNKKLFVLEDCALAPGATINNKHVGLHGDAGVFSFYPVKHITTAEGGMIILKDEKLSERLNLLKAFGVDKTHGDRKIPGVYDTVELGFNYRMSEIHAAIGVEQIKKLDLFLKTRKENFDILADHLKDIEEITIIPQPSNNNIYSCHYCCGVLLDPKLKDRRPSIITALMEKGVGSSVYYPQPVPRMTYYKNKYNYNSSMYKNAEKFSDTMLALPVGPHLNIDHMKFISLKLKECLMELK